MAEAGRGGEVEDRSAHLIRVLRAIRNVNQLINEESDPAGLAARSCSELTSSLGYRTSWIALAGDDGEGYPVLASSGFNGGFEFLKRRLSEGDLPRCIRMARESGGTVLVEEPGETCPDCPLDCNFENRTVLRRELSAGGRHYGVFGVSLPTPLAAEDEELELFEELSADLARALERMKAERQLGRARRRYREIFQGSRDGYVMVTPEGRIFDANQAFCDMLGYSLEELRQLPDFYSITPERWWEWEREEIWNRRLLGRGYSGLYEKEYVRSDGTVFPVELQSYVVRDASGGLDYLWGVARDITERRRAEEELRASERRFRRVLEDAPFPAMLHAEDGQVLALSRAWTEITGYSPAEIPDIHSWTERAYGERKEEARAVIDRLYGLDHRADEGEFEVICSDGSRRVWEFWSAPVPPLPDGRRCVVSMAADVTERRAAERVLTETRDHYRSLFESTLVGIGLSTPGGEIVEGNRAFAEMLGYSVEELAGMSVAGMYADPGDRLLLREAVDNKGALRDFDTRLLRKDGSPVNVRLSVSRIEINGRPFYQTVCRDTTEQVRAEEELRRSRERYKGLFNSALFGITVHDADGSIVAVNEAAERIFGIGEEELGRKEVAFWKGRLYHEDGSPQEPSEFPISRVARSGRAVEKTITGLKMSRDGDMRWFLHSAQPMFAEDGSFAGVSTCFMDITDRLRAERERERLQAQLNQAQRLESVGRLAGGVAHDFNNMLNVILGQAELALIGLKENDPMRESLTEIQDAARHSADLTRQLLAFARRQAVKPRVIDLNRTLQSLLNMLTRLIGEEIDLQWKPGADLQPVRIDPGQIDQLMTNLVVNSRDAIEGVGSIVIETDMVSVDQAFAEAHPESRPGRYAVLTVTDDGCGMAPETLEHIFEPFYTSKDQSEGTGLGLATVYGIVKQNDGFIDVYSEPGRGSSFRVYLPVHEGPAGRPEEGGKRPAAARGGGETVLLAEDEPAILRMTRTMLEHLGYRVLAARSPGEAMELAREHSGEIELLISDVVMPQMNGPELCRRLQGICPRLRSLFMSGYAADVTADRGLLEGGANFVQKPFSLDRLAEKVRAALDEG